MLILASTLCTWLMGILDRIRSPSIKFIMIVYAGFALVVVWVRGGCTSAWAVLGFVSLDIEPEKLTVFEVFLILAM